MHIPILPSWRTSVDSSQGAVTENLSVRRARAIPFLSREGKKREAFATARGACRACAVKTRQNDVEFLDRRGDDEAEISSSSRRTSTVRWFLNSSIFFFEEHLPLSSCSYKEWSFNVIPLFFFLVLKTSVSPALVRFPPVGSFIDRFHVWLTIATLTMVSYFLSFFFPLRPRCAISSVYLLPLSLGLDACASRWKLKHSSFFYVVKLFRNIALLKDLAASCLRWIHI